MKRCAAEFAVSAAQESKAKTMVDSVDGFCWWCQPLQNSWRLQCSTFCIILPGACRWFGARVGYFWMHQLPSFLMGMLTLKDEVNLRIFISQEQEMRARA